MTKRIFTFMLFALVVIVTTANAQVVLNEENFPDTNFRAALALKFGVNEGDEITEGMIAVTTNISVQHKAISDLTGIEHFTSLTKLDCFSNQIKSAAMDVLMASLPTVNNGELYVIDTRDENEGNICTKVQVAVAKAKGWKVYNNSNGYPYGGNYDAYEGSLSLHSMIFPDSNFRTALAEILNINEGDVISESMVAATKELDVSGRSITDLTGIEIFSALKSLDCSNNQLTTLDISKGEYILIYHKRCGCNYLF